MVDHPFKEEFRSRLRASRLLAILRGIPDTSLIHLAEVISETRIGFVEVTMNTPNAGRQIERLRDLLGSEVMVGAGTVLSVSEARLAVKSGASFLVSPCLVPEVQAWADENGIPTLPGAFTPQEVWNAIRAGGSMVKVFPSHTAGGPTYIKELRGPFRDVPLLACGGVNASNASEYLRSGADALAFGGSVFPPSRLKEGDFEGIRSDLLALRETCSRYTT
ncbi:MAG: bifunctional 4-hydroxy-2-oxoglutarate aldolase/2-dehydro-3-deoxy-phosphogluconate aldolase [Fibrobacteria bacterium]|nr:bifunctional 4-hydroxy-2-oxoglutarate aldolase/2-dehydro-3-deoxy-phosphogluconate aldolase [Fibrobacteria bacterium]